MWLLLLIAFILLLLLYTVLIKHRFWTRRGVPGPKPLPILGNLGTSIIGLRHMSEVYADIYRKYEDCPFVGVYRMGEPCLLIRDPDIIKNVLIKDFSHFMDNDVVADKELDPLISRNTFVLKADEWRRARQFITPNFATGKVKVAFSVAESIGKNLVAYLEKQGGLVIDAKDAFVKYNCDVIASYGFGIEGNSFNDPNAELMTLGRKFATPGNSIQAIKVALTILMPNLIKLKLVPKSFDDGVIALTNNTLQYRKENNIKRNDFLDAIAQTPSITPLEIAAHMANLIIDGFESTSTVNTFVLYEILSNPECQIKLRKEIDTVLKKHDGQFSYEAMQDMVYLDACINETLRLHPPLGQLSKVCTEDCTITSSGNEFRNLSVTLKKGSSVLISVLGLHRDPKYFPSPDKFIPERFLDKSESNKNVYMPFGTGPRMCIGSRFGLMLVKVGIAQLIRNFEMTLNEKTIYPLKYDPIYFSLYPKGGLWFNCKKIKLPE